MAARCVPQNRESGYDEKAERQLPAAAAECLYGDAARTHDSRVSADEEEENESLTAEATERTSSAPRVIRTPDLLIRRPAEQQTQPTSHDQPRKKSDDTEEK
jgi:hypothetical protein